MEKVECVEMVKDPAKVDSTPSVDPDPEITRHQCRDMNWEGK